MLIGNIARSRVTTVESEQENIVEDDEERNNEERLWLKLLGLDHFSNDQNDEDELRDNEQGCEDEWAPLDVPNNLALVSLVHCILGRCYLTLQQ